MVRRAQRAGRYDREPGVRIVAGYRPRSRAVLIEAGSGTRAVPVDVIGPDERRRRSAGGPDGLEPVALWLGVDGLPKKAAGTTAGTGPPAPAAARQSRPAAG